MNIKFLPENIMPQKIITVYIPIQENVTFSVEDETLNKNLEILTFALKGIYKVYRKNYLFTRPNLVFRPKGERQNTSEFYIKVGIFPKTEWKKKKPNQKEG